MKRFAAAPWRLEGEGAYGAGAVLRKYGAGIQAVPGVSNEWPKRPARWFSGDFFFVGWFFSPPFFFQERATQIMPGGALFNLVPQVAQWPEYVSLGPDGQLASARNALG